MLNDLRDLAEGALCGALATALALAALRIVTPENADAALAAAPSEPKQNASTILTPPIADPAGS